MADGKVSLTEEQSTLLATLYGRAVDALAARPILGDPYAAGVVRGIDFDFKKTRITPGTAGTVALRAKHLDDWTQQFLAAHTEAIVLHLGCGLDSRPYRIDPPEGVSWFDVDYPEVIELRRRLYPPRDRYHMIGTSVTDPGWLADVPADAPALVVAEGLMLYLTEEEGRQLLERLTGHFPTGEIVFDAVSRLGIRLQRFNAPLQATGASVHWGIDDPGELERWNPHLTCVTAIDVFTVPGRARLAPAYRAIYRLLACTPPLRRTARFLRYRW